MNSQEAFNQAQTAAAKPRAEAMKRLRDSGKTLQEIGDLFGLTRERVRALIARHFPGNAKRKRATTNQGE